MARERVCGSKTCGLVILLRSRTSVATRDIVSGVQAKRNISRMVRLGIQINKRIRGVNFLFSYGKRNIRHWGVYGWTMAISWTSPPCIAIMILRAHKCVHAADPPTTASVRSLISPQNDRECRLSGILRRQGTSTGVVACT
ncbi:hypothetical protein QR685DRAFT_537012 [Neurospora intermedia]|uniref:Uncharacterized protein n=1 Tax=Neurospora intermedia TaxID=5142 RepID=A0ABR3D091_NEUIN